MRGLWYTSSPNLPCTMTSASASFHDLGWLLLANHWLRTLATRWITVSGLKMDSSAIVVVSAELGGTLQINAGSVASRITIHHLPPHKLIHNPSSSYLVLLTTLSLNDVCSLCCLLSHLHRTSCSKHGSPNAPATSYWKPTQEELAFWPRDLPGKKNKRYKDLKRQRFDSKDFTLHV